MDVTNARYAGDFCVIERQGTGTVPGEFLGIDVVAQLAAELNAQDASGCFGMR
jgi:hypothetical protein